jgi:hydroxymethylbilane synthase
MAGPSRVLRLATRGSLLALTQSRHVADAITQTSNVPVELVTISTRGDRTRGSLAAEGGKGLFVKEVEQALLANEADVAVHSMKDMPVTMPLHDVEADLVVAAVPRRQDRRDVLITRRPLADLPRPHLGTGSPRREALLKAMMPEANVTPLRGNVDSRLEQVRTGQLDGVTLAAAGLRRLGWLSDLGLSDRTLYLTQLASDAFVPAAGQGALAVQCRRDDAGTRAVLAPLDHAASRRETEAERDVVRLLDGNCFTPIAATGEVVSEREVRLRVAFLEAGRLCRANLTAADAEVANLAIAAARRPQQL